jgi:hypothetical protein
VREDLETAVTGVHDAHWLEPPQVAVDVASLIETGTATGTLASGSAAVVTTATESLLPLTEAAAAGSAHIIDAAIAHLGAATAGLSAPQ